MVYLVDLVSQLRIQVGARYCQVSNVPSIGRYPVVLLAMGFEV